MPEQVGSKNGNSFLP